MKCTSIVFLPSDACVVVPSVCSVLGNHLLSVCKPLHEGVDDKVAFIPVFCVVTSHLTWDSLPFVYALQRLQRNWKTLGQDLPFNTILS